MVVLRIQSPKFDFQTASQSQIAFKMAKMSKYDHIFRIRKICCGYSKLVSRDAWNTQKGIRLIRSPSPEKTSKTCSVSIVLKMSNLFHVLDVFSGLCSRINLIPFPVFQASCDTSLEYPQQGIPIWKIWPYFDLLAIFKAISDWLAVWKLNFLLRILNTTIIQHHNPLVQHYNSLFNLFQHRHCLAIDVTY